MKHLIATISFTSKYLGASLMYELTQREVERKRNSKSAEIVVE